MPKYTYRNGRLEDENGLPMLNQDERARELQTPRVWSDLPGYRSPIDGTWVEGRRARKYDLEKNNCVDANELGSPTKGKLRNKRFAEKHGLGHLIEQ